MAERVQIQIEAVDAASGVFRGIVSQFGNLGKVASDVSDVFIAQEKAVDLATRAFSDASISIEDIEKAEELAGAATGRLAEQLASLAITFVGDSIKAFSDYTEEVKNFSRATGTSAEQASRLIQIADDVRVSTDTLTTALRSASKKGVEFTVESLKSLSDQYLALSPGVERNTFLIEKFGRSGLEMGKLLEKGSDGIDALNKGVEESLILNEEAIRSAEKYKQALDKWADTWDSIKTSVGGSAVGVINKLTDGTDDLARAQELAKESGYNLVRAQDLIARGFLQQAVSEREAKEAMELNVAVTQQLGSETALTTQEIQGMTAANEGLFSLVQSLQNETTNYNESLATQTAKHEELRLKLEEAIVTYGANSEQVAKLREQYDASGASIDALAQKHTAAMNQIAYDLLVAKLKADGFSDAEYNMAIQAGVSLGIIDSKVAATAINMNKIATAAATSKDGTAQFGDTMSKIMGDGIITSGELQSAMDKMNTLSAREEMSELNGALEDIDEMIDELDGSTIDITVNYTTNGNPPYNPESALPSGSGRTTPRDNMSRGYFVPSMAGGESANGANYHTHYLYNPQIYLVQGQPEADSLLSAFRK